MPDFIQMANEFKENAKQKIQNHAVNEEFNKMPDSVKKEEKESSSNGWDLDRAIGHTLAEYEIKMDSREMILYALSIGFQKDPLNQDDFIFTNMKTPGFSAFPTIGLALAHRQNSGVDVLVPGMPAFNPMKLVHGEESIQILKPIKPDQTVNCKEYVIDIQDKGENTIVVTRTDITDSKTSELHAIIHMSLFVKDLKGSGHVGTFMKFVGIAPEREPCVTLIEKTDPNLAFLFSLCGDRNPLHIDPSMSKIGGYDVPILHGLCTFGITARSVQQSFFKDDADRLSEMSARFTSHVLPGDTLIIDMW